MSPVHLVWSLPGRKASNVTVHWKETKSAFDVLRSLFFLMPMLVHTLLHCGNFRHKLISRISRYKKIREIKVKRAISVAIITWHEK